MEYLVPGNQFLHSCMVFTLYVCDGHYTSKYDIIHSCYCISDWMLLLITVIAAL